MTLTPQLLHTIGNALYGAGWMPQLAMDLDVNLRTLQRWAGGQYTIPEGIKAELAAICRERGMALEVLAAGLQQPENEPAAPYEDLPDN